MSQQTETNSIGNINEINNNNDVSYDQIQIPRSTGYFGSRETFVFLLCESCFWCASASNICFIKNPRCPMCSGDKIALIPISRG
jgi:hypothetical protein